MCARRYLFALWVVMMSAPLLAAQTLEPPRSAGPATYIIQPNDVLQIFVWKDTNLSAKVTVRPDGRISVPLVQDMQAAGISPAQLKSRLEAALKEFVEVPNVTVIVEAILSYRVFVTGRVVKPGMIAFEKPISVLQAIALAGGFQEFANQSGTVIIRNTGEDSVLYRFNYPEVIQGKNFSQNMLLKSGDVIVVP